MLRRSAHSVHEIVFHFTFIPKYRKRRLVGRVKKRIEGMIRFSAQLNEWEVMELSIQPDHIHIVMRVNGTDSAASVMKTIKGGTSKKIREIYPDLVESIWSRNFWGRGYYAGSVGRVDLAKVRQYVQEQNKVKQETADS